MARTVQSVRQAVYTALTSPPLQYQINAGTIQTLPTANVIPRSVWLTGSEQAPMPLVAFDVATRGILSRHLPERVMTVTIWVVSATGPDEVTEIYEALRAVLHVADQDGPADLQSSPADLSRAATSSTLGLAVRECIEQRVSTVDFEHETSRWYRVAEYRVIAI